ncbi:NAD-dependent epimerase/dehydratase family protein [Spirosoma sp. HMF4905]|uniref:NAD-dependent epimerase/dehydratase family protein n=1 Tax=Spirosoma arboris TaxID=2682092 RepID=A0A7K1S9E8_9BACT|nr:NAD-dependent epimerase/dehydratase family protein [Spirosoma arboris]MVM30166.1 NAD-dependent epimerase/dehydratase family protein [Spirosoma arboris]
MKTILGTGQLGITIMETLLQNNPNEEILLVNRKGKLATSIPKNVRVIAADVTNKNELEAIAQKSEVIFSCTDVTYQLWDEFYPAVATALAYALSKTKARLVFADNLYSYGNVSGAEMTENMPHKATTKKGKIRASVINTLVNSGQEFTNRVAFVKAADFVGPRIYKGLFGTDFLDKLHTGKTIILFGNAALPHNFTYINDFATAMINVGNSTDAFGQIWHVPNASALTLTNWVHLFEAEAKTKAKVLVLPKFVVWIAGLFNSLIKEFYELSYQFEYPYLVNHDKYIARFGNQSTDSLHIVRETVQWYKSTKKE